MICLHLKTDLRAHAMSAVLTLVVLMAGHGKAHFAGSADKEGKGHAVEKVHIVAERFNFTPSKIKAKQGVLLEITLTSEDTFHGFRIAAQRPPSCAVESHTTSALSSTTARSSTGCRTTTTRTAQTGSRSQTATAS